MVVGEKLRDSHTADLATTYNPKAIPANPAKTDKPKKEKSKEDKKKEKKEKNHLLRPFGSPRRRQKPPLRLRRFMRSLPFPMGKSPGYGIPPPGDIYSANKSMRQRAAPSQNPVNFTTGGGAQQSVKSLAFKGSPILEGEEVYILNECPPAQSIGKTVMDKGYMFIWDPREQVPYLVPPSVVPNCKLRIPRKHRICASRVVEYVPQYDEEVTPVDFVPPDQLQPMGAVDASPASTNHEFSDGELSTPSVADHQNPILAKVRVQ